MRTAACWTVILLLVPAPAWADGSCTSGLKPGQKPGPYSSLVSVGPQRGQSHCFICETADRPAVIVFARSLSAPLGKLANKLDRALEQHRATELRGWITFLDDNQPALDPLVVAWGKQYALRHLALTIFEDAGGPPTYRLHHDADVTVFLSVKQKLVRSFAFRPGELTPERSDEILDALTRILPPNRKERP